MYVLVDVLSELITCLQVDGRCRNKLVSGPEFGPML